MVVREEETTKPIIPLETFSRREKCPFMLRSMPSGIGCKVSLRCGVQNNELAKNLVAHDILDRLKPHERQFVNEMDKIQHGVEVHSCRFEK